MISFIKESDEVLYPNEDIVIIDKNDLNRLKELALLNHRQRIRLCAHRTKHNSLHEMYIVHTSECYVRPHKHLNKAESMAVIEGEVDVVLFYENGDIHKVIKMGEVNSGKPFYYRLSEPVYHTLLIRTPFLVFHEITEGPFLREHTVFPEWAPDQENIDFKAFMKQIDSKISKLK